MDGTQNFGHGIK